MNTDDSMVKLFTVNFLYQGKSYTALVSFREGYDLSFLVRYLDKDANKWIPDGKIIVSLLEGLKTPKQLSKEAEEFVFQTTEAISGFLKLQMG
jgi:hypothetical protein